MQQIIHLRA